MKLIEHMPPFIAKMRCYVEVRPRLRKVVGFSLIVAGALGAVLPILGVWLIPIGLGLLALDYAWANRWVEKAKAWFERHRPRRP